MGENTLITAVAGTKIPSTHNNGLVEALEADFVPRNSSSVATNEAGDLGTSYLSWKRAFIESGYLSIGMEMSMQTYNGLLPIPQGYMIQNGVLINSTTYDAQHSVGDWAKYIISSVLDGKYIPDKTGNVYSVGASATTQDGTSSFTFVGNASSTVDLKHNHQWYEAGYTTAENTTYTSTGVEVILNNNKEATAASDNLNYDSLNASQTVATKGLDDSYTTNAFVTTAGGTTTSPVDIKPESLETVFLMRII